MATHNHYDNRTLFIKCDCANSDQIRQSFIDSLEEYRQKTGDNIDCRVKVNLVENREGKSFGIAFVFLTNPAVYYMLLGKNKDGSDRIDYIDDPSWIKPEEGKNVNDNGWFSMSEPIPEPVFTPGTKWADMVEWEEEYEKMIIKRENKCPKIPVQLDHLMILPPFKLTDEQIDEKRNKIIADNDNKHNFDPKMVEVTEYSYFSIDRAMVVPLENKFMPNILKSKEIPLWIKREDIKAQFSPYASDNTTMHDRYIKGRKIEETYPFVNINENRVAFVIFDPSTHDGQFCLHMMKKCVIKKKKEDGTMNVATLIFWHSYRTDRDVVSSVNQEPKVVRFNQEPKKRYLR